MNSTPRIVAGFGGLSAATAWSIRHVTADTVRHWQPSLATTSRAGGLSVSTLGSGRSATVLLHGLAGCGAYYGKRYDALATGRRLVAPDLLGYGDSYRSPAPSGFGLEGQLDALDAMADALGLHGPLTVVGHSMGASLALHWAARRPTQVERVVAFSAPLYLNPEEGFAHVRELGLLERFMARRDALSERTCAWMCQHRTAASWLAVALTPDRPVYIARRGVLHTWPAYTATMNEIVLDSRWQGALATLARNDVPVVFANGDRDPIPVVGRTTHLARTYPSVTAMSRPDIGHDLPLGDPDWCLLQLAPGRQRAATRRAV